MRPSSVTFSSELPNSSFISARELRSACTICVSSSAGLCGTGMGEKAALAAAVSPQPPLTCSGDISWLWRCMGGGLCRPPRPPSRLSRSTGTPLRGCPAAAVAAAAAAATGVVIAVVTAAVATVPPETWRHGLTVVMIHRTDEPLGPTAATTVAAMVVGVVGVSTAATAVGEASDAATSVLERSKRSSGCLKTPSTRASILTTTSTSP
mmetsp:Transcript_3010/g.6359  ORF Transcript_3010/g.6359 Transcript_3010/m.6359 type:complete len:208 (+) Transcript_3010:145-768(+)